jgi:hypothetical protein
MTMVVHPDCITPLGRRHADDVAARPRPGSDGQVRKIKLDQRRSIEILDFGEPEAQGASMQLSRIKITAERLAAGRHALGHLLMIIPRCGVFDPIGRIGVIEHDFRPARQARDLAERREDRILSQIGRDAEPQHEGPPVRVEACGLEGGGHASALEIVSYICHMRGFGDPRLGEPPPLVVLSRRMIELEDAQILSRLKSIGEGVETCAEHDDLPHAVTNCAPRRVLGEAAAHRDEQAQRPPLRPLFGERNRIVGVLPEDGERERVGEDKPTLENLVRRSVSGRADRG